MWKKTFIRSSVIGLVALAALVVFASSKSHIEREPDTDECRSASSAKEGCEAKAQADFVLWESLSKTIMSGVSY